MWVDIIFQSFIQKNVKKSHGNTNDDFVKLNNGKYLRPTWILAIRDRVFYAYNILNRFNLNTFILFNEPFYGGYFFLCSEKFNHYICIWPSVASQTFSDYTSNDIILYSMTIMLHIYDICHILCSNSVQVYQ